MSFGSVLRAIGMGIGKFFRDVRIGLDAAAQLRAKREATTHATGKGHNATTDNVTADDEHEGPYGPMPPPRTLKGVRLHIRFQDRNGTVTERDVVTNVYAHDPATGKGDQYTADLWAAVTAIVQSDKTPSEQEIKYLRYAADRLKQPMPDGIPAR
jgi:hypothetical protein